MADSITLTLDASEQHIVTAALLLYEAHLCAAETLGGDARETAESVGPIARRVQCRLFDAMYGPDGEPEWVDPITAAKAERDRHADCDCHYINRQAEQLGDYPADISYHDYQAAR
jgi:hypothetical protein